MRINFSFLFICLIIFSATVRTSTAAPEIDILIDGVSYPNGSTYDFGNKPVNSSTVITFTVANTGNATLQLPGGGFSGSAYTFYHTNVDPYIAAGSSSSMTIRFEPKSVESFNYEVRYNTNDPDESPCIIYFIGSASPVTPIFASSGQDDLSVYQASSGKIKIKGLAEAEYTYTLSSLHGNSLMTGSLNSINGEAELPTTQLNRGLYLLSFTNNKKNIQSVKIIIEK